MNNTPTTLRSRYCHLEINPRDDFHIFRVIDVGRKKQIKMVIGKFKDGTWKIHKWLVPKRYIFVSSSGHLDSELPDVKRILNYCGKHWRNKTDDSYYLSNEERPQKSCIPLQEMYFNDYEEYEQFYKEHSKP